MADQFTKVTRNSWGSRIAGSFGGVVFGIILIPLCIWGLWNNEGTKDLSELAKLSVVVSSDSVDASKDGVFASVSGKLVSEEQIGDDPFMVPGAYITLDRNTEMYAWKETTSSKEVKDTVGGGSTTTTTYSYSKEWTSSPANSGSFENPAGHENPTKSIDGASYVVSAATIGAYSINPATISLPGGDQIDVKPADGIEGFFKNGRFLYNREGANSAPQVGDMRVSFSALKSDVSVTAMGKLNSGAIESHTDESFTEGSRTLYRVFLGSRDDAIAQLRFEYVVWIWAIRILGILGLWIGLGLLVGPIVKILDVVGVIGSVADGIMGFVNFFVALTIGGTTIIVSMLFHNIYFLILIIALIIAGVVYFLRGRSVKALAAGLVPAAATPATGDNANNSPPKMG